MISVIPFKLLRAIINDEDGLQRTTQPPDLLEIFDPIARSGFWVYFVGAALPRPDELKPLWRQANPSYHCVRIVQSGRGPHSNVEVLKTELKKSIETRALV